MKSTRELRNKVLHGDFLVEREKLEKLGHAPPGPTVVRKAEMDAALSPIAQVFDARDRAEALDPAKHPIGGNILGWLMQCGQDGTFAKGIASFMKGIEILDRLAERADNVP